MNFGSWRLLGLRLWTGALSLSDGRPSGLRQALLASLAMTEGVRLQKVLAAAGVASRRACEVMISEGRVEVNGSLVTEQGLRVDPDRDVIRVDGSRIPPPRRHSYLVLNKPRGVVSTLSDPEGRQTLSDFVADRRDRLFH